MGATIAPDPQGDKITSFFLEFLPADYSTMGHVVSDLTSLTYQPTTKSSNRSGYPKRHVTFAMSERKPAYPAHVPDMRMKMKMRTANNKKRTARRRT